MLPVSVVFRRSRFRGTVVEQGFSDRWYRISAGASESFDGETTVYGPKVVRCRCYDDGESEVDVYDADQPIPPSETR